MTTFFIRGIIFSKVAKEMNQKMNRIEGTKQTGFIPGLPVK